MNAKIIVGVIIGVICISIVTTTLGEDRNDYSGSVIDVIIIDGQSNSAYSTNSEIVDISVVATDYPNAPSHNLYYYGTDSAPIMYGSPGNPTYDDTFASYAVYNMRSNDAWIIGGYEPGLAYTISERSGHDVLVINVGVPGATVAELSPDGECGIYGQAVIEHALDIVAEDYDNVNLLGYMWAQGEADYSTSIAAYKEDFMEIFTYMHNFGAENCYIVATKLRWGNSVIAQNELVQNNSHIIMATTVTYEFTTSNGYLLSDNTHYTQEGRDIIAEDVGNAVELTHGGQAYKNVHSAGIIVPIVLAAGIILYVVSTYYRNRD